MLGHDTSGDQQRGDRDLEEERNERGDNETHDDVTHQRVDRYDSARVDCGLLGGQEDYLPNRVDDVGEQTESAEEDEQFVRQNAADPRSLTQYANQEVENVALSQTPAQSLACVVETGREWLEKERTG